MSEITCTKKDYKSYNELEVDNCARWAEGMLAELCELFTPGTDGVEASELLVCNLNHLMALYAPEMCKTEKVDVARKAIEEAGGMLAFLCDCKDLARKDKQV